MEKLGPVQLSSQTAQGGIVESSTTQGLPSLVGRTANDDAQTPRLESTPIPEMYRLQNGAGLGLDVANVKGEKAADGFISYDDAKARGISRADWQTAVASGKPSQLLNRIIALFKGADAKVAVPPAAHAKDPERTERVTLQNGRPHFMSPAMKKACDDQVRSMFDELATARAQGKRTMYISTFISSVDPKTNLAIARFVQDKIEKDPQWGGTVHVLNPGTRQGLLPKGAIGDDFMYMWEQLLGMNVFHAVRFTSADDTKDYFAARAEKVPSDYIFTYGDALHSAGCRYEWNIFANINKDLARQNKSHCMVAIYHGDLPVSPPLLTKTLDTVDYKHRGEILE